MTEPGKQDWARASALFTELIQLDTADRARRLAAIGDDDPPLRKTIEALLAADEVADEKLARFEFGVSQLVRDRVIPQVTSADPLEIVGTTISHFAIVDFLASGGMGVVYRARDVQLNRIVALKFPLPHHRLDAAMKERFMREAHAAGALEHINLCTVHEIGESEKGLFLAMPLYPGETLKERLSRKQRLELRESLAIAKQIASGLACAHQAGVIHRDLKPGNVMLLPDDTVKILDFGLAKAGDVTATKSGVTLGTVSYMAPEQIRGAKVDSRADLWSLGVILYEMLTGVRPFAGEHDVSIAHAILHNDPKPPSSMRADLPRPVQDLVLGLLQKNPANRYAGSAQLAADLDALSAGKPPAYRPRLEPRVVGLLRRRRMIVALVLVAIATASVVIAAPGISAALNKPTKNADAYRFYQRGREYEERGSVAAAESLYVRALALDSGFALARARLAIVYAECSVGGSRDCYRQDINSRRMDRVEQIRTEAEHALKQQPRLADAHFAMGLYWEKRQDPARALTEYALAENGVGKSGDLHAAIGRAYRAQGKWNNAIDELERAIEMDPNDYLSMADLATTFSRLRRYEESAKMWNRYLALSPDANPGALIKGNVYLRWQGTVDTLSAILQAMSPELQRRSFETRVLIARIRNRPQDALAALDELPRQVTEDPETNRPPALLRAHVYSDMGDSAKARIYYDSARVLVEKKARARPDDFRPQIVLGLAYAGLRRSRDAQRAAQRAMALMPASRDFVSGTTAMRGAAEIFAQIPEQHGAAIRILDQLMRMPAGREASYQWLRVDPAWRPIRSDPRFLEMLARYSQQ